MSNSRRHLVGCAALIALGALACGGSEQSGTGTAPPPPAVATQLVLTREPAGAVSGKPFTTQPVVEVRDASGAVVSSASTRVTAAVDSGSGALAGTTTVSAVNGVATFTDLVVTGSGSDRLTFTASGLTSATSGAFAVAQLETQLAVTAQPNYAVTGIAFGVQPAVEIRDAGGTKVAVAADSVTVSIASGTGTLTGPTTVAAVNGVATFAGLAISEAGTFTLAFKAPGLSGATANALTVNSPQVVQALATDAIRNWYEASTGTDPWVMFNVTGDLMTMNFSNFGARFDNVEPRIAYENDPSSVDAEAAATPWTSDYAIVNEADLVLGDIQAGAQLPGGTDKYRDLALLAQAGALMQVSLIFDQGLAVDENAVPAAARTLVPYANMEALARSKLDSLIAHTSGGAYAYSQVEFPMVGGLTTPALNRIANTMAAQLLAYSPRTAAQAATVDWAKVLAYASNGIGTGNAGAPFDLTVMNDYNTWYSQIDGYFDLASWMSVDLRLIHQMAPNVPDTYAGAQQTCGSDDTACYDSIYAPRPPYDARLGIDYTNTNATRDSAGTDFYYARQVVGDAARGIYMQSPYYHGRYIPESYQVSSPIGPAPYILAAESDLLRAEALIRTGGDRGLAAQLVNNTRVNRGHLTPLTAADNDSTFLHAITYEREVECLSTDGFGFFALRHVDQLQDGTVRELPVPAAELTALGLPVYTFGGVGNPVMSVLARGVGLPFGSPGRAFGQGLAFGMPVRTPPPRGPGIHK